MKRVQKILCLVLAMLLLISICSTASARVGDFYIVKGDGLHLRKSPKGGVGNEDNILASLRAGAKVQLLATSGNWWKVQTASEKKGWVFSSFLKSAGTSASISTKSAGTYHVKCSSLNVRASASSSGKKIGSLRRGKAVEILAVKDGWGKIKSKDGRIGYIAMKYVG